MSQTDALPAILNALFGRLESARQAASTNPAQAFALSSTTLGTDGAAIVGAFSQALGVNSIAFQDDVRISTSQDSVLVAGTAAQALLGVSDMELEARFLAPGTALELSLALTVPDATGWVCSHSFPQLQYTFFDLLAFDASAPPAFTLATYSYSNSYSYNSQTYEYQVVAGLNLFAAVALTGPLAAVAQWMPKLPQPLPLYGSVTTDTGAFALSLAAPLPAASLQIEGLVQFELASPLLYLSALPSDDPDTPATSLAVQSQSATLGAVVLPIAVIPPTINVADSWQVTLAPAGASPSVDVGPCLSIFQQTSLLVLLPEDIRPLTGLVLSDLTIAFDFSSKALQWLSVAISSLNSDGSSVASAPVWRIYPGIVELSALTIALEIFPDTGGTADPYDPDAAPGLDIQGSVAGTFKIGEQLSVTASVPLPIGSGYWTISAQGVFALTGALASFDKLLHTSLATKLPPRLGQIGSFTLQDLAVVFDPEANKLVELWLSISSTNIWPVAAGIDLNMVRFAVDIVDPLGAQALTGEIDGVFQIGDAAVSLAVYKTDPAGDWLLQVTSDWIPLPNIDDLTALFRGQRPSLLLPDQASASQPAISDLEIAANLSQQAVTKISATLANGAAWAPVSGVNLSILEALLYFDLDWTSGKLKSQARLSGTVQLASTYLFALVAKSNATWTIAAVLRTGEGNVDLAPLAKQLVATSAILPTQYGFPSAAQLSSANLLVNLPDQIIHIDALVSANFTWPFSFAQSNLVILQLAIVLDIQKRLDNKTLPYTFSISGGFVFAGITTTLIFATSNQPGDTILTAQLDNSQSLNLPGIASALTVASATQKNPQGWGDLNGSVPAGLAAPGLFGAGLAINLTQNVFMLYGTTAAPGGAGASALFLTAKQADSSWGYLAAFGLSQGFTFESLLAALKPLDGVLTVSQANLLISSLAAPDVQALINALPASAGAGQPSPRAQASQTIQLAAGPQDVTPQTAALQPGVNFYAALQLGAPLAQVAQPATATSTFRLVGFIAANGSLTRFSANLGQLKLLNLLTFQNVALTYTGAASSTFTLTGTVAVTVLQQTYSFAGAVAMVRTGTGASTTTTAAASIVTTQTIDNALGMTGLTIASLAFVLDYSSSAAQSDITWRLGGSMSYADLVGLDGFIYFKGTAPQVAGARIARLAVDDLFAKIFKKAWPAGLLDITFYNGMLFYAPEATTLTLPGPSGQPPAQVPFAQGFNMTTLIDVYALKGMRLSGSLTTSGSNTGLSGSLSYDTPLDWGFLSLYRAGDPSHGPEGTFDSRSSAFELSAGVGLFGAPLLSTAIQVDDEAMTGTLSSDQPLGPFGKPAIGFAWDNQGFRVTSWPAGLVKLPDFDFENIQLSGDCPVSGIVKLPIRSQIDLTPGLSISMSGPDGPTLVITLNGRLDLVVNSSAYSNTLLSANIADARLELTLPLASARAFSWSDLADRCVACLQGAAASLFDNLVKDPNNLAKLLAVQGIEWSANKLTGFLVCHLTKDMAVSEAEAAVEAAAFVEAASSATPVLVAIAGAAAGVVVGGVIGQQGADGNWTNSSQPQPPPAVPAAPSLSYANGTLTVSWGAVANASAYVVGLLQDGSRFASSRPSGALTQQFAAPAGHTYTAKVVASSSGGSSTSPSSTLVALGQPASVSLTYAPGKVTVGWSQVPNAGGYDVQLLGAGNAPIGSPTHAGSGASSQDFPIANLPPGPIGARVMATSSDPNTVPGAWTAAASGLTLLGQPSLTGVTYGVGGLQVSWSAAVPGATSYLAQLLDANHNPVGSPQSVPALSGGNPTLQAALPPPTGGVNGEAIYVQVMATDSGAGVIPGAWSVSAAYTPQRLLADLAALGMGAQAQALRDLFGSCNSSPARVGVLLNTLATPTPTAPQVAAALQLAFPQQTGSAAAMAAILASVYTSPALTAQQMAGALAPLYRAAPVAAVLRQSYLADTAQAQQMAALLSAAYTVAVQPLPIADMVHALAPLYPAPDTARALVATYGEQIDGPAALAAQLQSAYSPATLTAAMMAQALNAGGYPAQQAAPVLRQLYPTDTGTPAAMAALLTQAYSPLSDEQLTRALALSPYPVGDVAIHLKGLRDPSGTNAAGIGLLLVGAYTDPPLTSAQLSAALSGAHYSASAVSGALQQLFGDDTKTTAQLAALLAQSYPPEEVADALRAERPSDTANATQMLAILQAAYASQGLGAATLAPGLGSYPPLDVARALQQSYPSGTANATQMATLLDAAFDDPRLGAAPLAQTLARCWYAAADVRQALATRGSSAQEQASALAAAYSLDTLAANAADAQAAGGSVRDTANKLYLLIAGLDVAALAPSVAAALVVAGYGAKSSLQALVASYGSALPIGQVTTVIQAAYSRDTLARRAALLNTRGSQAADAASDLLNGFGDMAALVDMTIGLVLGGYTATAALSGMNQAYGAGFVSQAVTVMLAVYSQDTYNQDAARCYAQGLDAQAATQQLQTQFAPHITAGQVSQALAQAGYTVG